MATRNHSPTAEAQHTGKRIGKNTYAHIHMQPTLEEVTALFGVSIVEEAQQLTHDQVDPELVHEAAGVLLLKREGQRNRPN